MQENHNNFQAMLKIVKDFCFCKKENTNDMTRNWIQCFCERKGNELFCEVDKEYIKTSLNLYGIEEFIPHYNVARDIIMDKRTRKIRRTERNVIKTATETLYGLIHARFINTIHGMMKMLKKSIAGDFGFCKKVYCVNHPLLPVGLDDTPGLYSVKMYCSRCMDVFEPDSPYHTNVDGAFFGSTFPHLLFMTIPEACSFPPKEKFVPRLYGFKIHPNADENTKRKRKLVKKKHNKKRTSFAKKWKMLQRNKAKCSRPTFLVKMKYYCTKNTHKNS